VLGACCYIAAQNEARARKEAAFREEREAQVRRSAFLHVPLGYSRQRQLTAQAMSCIQRADMH